MHTAVELPKPRNRREGRADVAGHEPAAWRVNDWLRKVPVSRTKFYEERGAGRIKTVKCGSATLVTTTPKEYLSALRELSSAEAA